MGKGEVIGIVKLPITQIANYIIAAPLITGQMMVQLSLHYPRSLRLWRAFLEAYAKQYEWDKICKVGFNGLPFEMQLGIIIRFFSQYGKKHCPPQMNMEMIVLWMIDNFDTLNQEIKK